MRACHAHHGGAGVIDDLADNCHAPKYVLKPAAMATDSPQHGLHEPITALMLMRYQDAACNCGTGEPDS